MAGGSVTFGGLASGIDTNALIEGLVNAERAGLNRITNRKASVDAAKSTISGIVSKLAALKTAATALKSSTGFASFTATNTTADIVPSVTGTPSGGTYNVQVTQLAKEERTYTGTHASSSTALAQVGNLVFTINSVATTITLDGSESLAGVASEINSSGAEAAASVIFDGTNYRLQIRGTETGSANAITFSQTGSVTLATGMTEVQAAQNSTVTVDSFTITGTSNTIADVIPGVTLSLKATQATASQVEIAGDSDALAAKIQTFVTAYNDVVNSTKTALTVVRVNGRVTSGNAELSGDQGLRSVLDKLGREMSNEIVATGEFRTFRSVGLKMASTNDGTLTLDTAALETAMGENPAAVAQLFVYDTALSYDGAMDDFEDLVDDLSDSSNTYATLTARMAAFTRMSTTLGEDETKWERRLEDYESRLRAQFAQLESIISGINGQSGSLTSLQNLSQ